MVTASARACLLCPQLGSIDGLQPHLLLGRLHSYYYTHTSLQFSPSTQITTVAACRHRCAVSSSAHHD